MTSRQQQNQLFSPSLISPQVQAQLPEGYLMRPLERFDFEKGYFEVLAGLTVVGEVSQEQFLETFEAMLQCQNVYHIVVIEDLKLGRVVATGTLIVEQKFLRGCAKAGHIEDIVVHDSQRGKKFGIRLIDQLKFLGSAVGCYKLLLTCSESNEPFYQKSDFERKDLHMALYLNKQPSAAQLPSQPQPQPPQQSIIVLPTPVPVSAFPALAAAAAAAPLVAPMVHHHAQTPLHAAVVPPPHVTATTTTNTTTTTTTTIMSEKALCSPTTTSASTTMTITTAGINNINAVNATSLTSPTPAAAPNSKSCSPNDDSEFKPKSTRTLSGHGVPLESLRASMESVFVK